MAGQYRKSRRKKTLAGPAAGLLGFAVILILLWISFGSTVMDCFFTDGGRKDLNEWFEVSGNRFRIYLDYELSDAEGLAESGELYLPFDFVNEELNSHFYWNADEQLLTYTLPDEVRDYTAETRFSEKSAFTVSGEDVYISLDLIEGVTDITHTQFCGDEDAAKRVFLMRGGSELQKITLTRKAKLRTATDKKAAWLTQLSKGSPLILTERMNDWSRVVSQDGFVGYIPNTVYDESGITSETLGHTGEEAQDVRVMLGEKLVMGWQQFTDAEENSRVQSLIDNTGGVMNAISPQWLQIDDADGDLVDYADSSYVETAHAAGLKVYPMVDNIGREGGIHDFRTGDFFADTERRRAFIDKLMKHADTYGYDGFNLDFEGIAQDAGAAYVQFIRELSVACHNRGLTLSVDNYVPYSYNEHYDLQEQGYYADYVIIMGYDEHTGEDIGPVASVGFAEYGITAALDHVPAEKLILGVPFFTRVWRTNDGKVSSEAMGIAASEQYASDNAIELSWDEETGAYYGETMIGTGKIQLWLEENNSIEKKIELIKNYQIGGLSAWRLGLEPADIWAEMDLNRE